MTLFDNPRSFHAHSGSSNPGANAGTVAISSCVTGFQYSLSIVNTISPPVASSIFDHNIIPKTRFAKFSGRDAVEDVEPKASKIASSITSEHLSEFRSLYHILWDYVLILPHLHERANALPLPPGVSQCTKNT